MKYLYAMHMHNDVITVSLYSNKEERTSPVSSHMKKLLIQDIKLAPFLYK